MNRIRMLANRCHCCLVQAASAHAEVDAQAALARAALRELGAHVRELSTQRGAVGPLLDCVARAVDRLTDHR